MNIKQSIVLFFLSLPLQFFAQQQPIIVKNGVPQFKIVLTANPTDAEEKAAIIFQSAIQKMAGCRMDILKTDEPNIQRAIYIMPTKVPAYLNPHFTPEFETKKQQVLLFIL